MAKMCPLGGVGRAFVLHPINIYGAPARGRTPCSVLKTDTPQVPKVMGEQPNRVYIKIIVHYNKYYDDMHRMMRLEVIRWPEKREGR